MSLESQIATKAKEIHTDGYPMSIGEILSLYRDGDIDIHPEFQRVFRWEDNQKSSLIESILLGIPIPPIFVSQRSDGIWDVIDGVQRLSTIFEFMGVYTDEHGVVLTPLVLQATEYLPALEGYSWEIPADGGSVFTEAMKRDVKRAKLEFRIIRKESDENAKYDLFQRLNSGTELSPQEARNCLLIMLKPAMYSQLETLSEYSEFKESVPLSEQKQIQAYRQELVLRFFFQSAYSGSGVEFREQYGPYLTRWMRNAAQAYETEDYPINTDLFTRTFRLLNSVMGEDTFRRFNGEKNLGPFSIASFEFVTAGVSHNIDLWESNKDKLVERVRSIWTASDFRDNSGNGVSPRRRVPRLILTARTYFAQVS